MILNTFISISISSVVFALWYYIYINVNDSSADPSD